jgi:hypothetical protein
MSYANTVASLPGTWKYLRNRWAPKTLNNDGTGWVAQIGFSTTYANLVPFVLAIAGSNQTITTSFGSMVRVQRLQHPEYTGLYAVRVRTEATGESSGPGVDQMYSMVKVLVEFSTMPFGTSGDSAFMTWETTQSSQYTTLPGKKYKFSTGEPLDQEVGVPANLNTYVLTLFNCPTLDDATIDTVMASPVNSATFRGKPAGSLMFGGCQSVYQTSVGGVVTFQKSFSFTYRSYDWNAAYKHDGTLGFPLDPANNPPFATCDFNTLLS